MRRFVDTNVLVYAYDGAEPAKRAVAVELLTDLWERREGAISTQVLQEFFVTVSGKWRERAIAVDGRAVVELYNEWNPFAPAGPDVLEAIDLSKRHQVSYWDSLILVAAAKSGAEVLLSEDLNHGQMIEGIRIENPFASIVS